MKNWLIIILIFIIICIVGYMNKNAYKECVNNYSIECENNGYSNCTNKAKEYCQFIKK